MASSKHILDLRHLKRHKENNKTDDIIPENPAQDKGYFDFDGNEPSDRPSRLFSFDASQIREELKYDISKRRQKNDTDEDKRPKLAPSPQFNIEPGFVADLKYSFSSWRQRRKQAKNLNHVDFSRHVRPPAGYKRRGLLFNAISLVGWMIEKFFSLIVYLLKLIKAIFMSPILVLDRLLDVIAYLVRLVFRLVFIDSLRLLDRAYQRLKGLEFQPPYLWYRNLGTFMLIAALIILPIKLFFEVPKILTAKQEVLGISSRALNYLGLFNELHGYLPAAMVAKEIGGYNGPRRFLLIFQNNAELRATGGFMGSYALADVDNGQIVDLQIPSGGFYDLKGYTTDFVEAPLPFHIFSPYWQIWNANWFADYPTSAKKVAKFYENSTGPTVDGVISVTPNTMEDLLELVGPIELPEYEAIIDADNFRRQTQVEVEYEYDKEANTPKAFIGAMAPIMIDRIFNMVDEGDIKELLAVIDKSLEEKQLLIYSTDPETQSLLEELNWAGSVRDTSTDYLQVVHTNIGGGKTDLVIADSLQQEIKVSPDGSVINEVKLTRTHRGDPDDIFEGHDSLDYVRFYVPQGSRLLSAEGFTQDDLTQRYKTADEQIAQDTDLASLKNATTDFKSGTQIFDESGKTVFANWLGLKPGQSKTVSVRYKLPFTVSVDGPYKIYWQKQSGTQGAPLQVTISMPDHLQFVDWLPQDSHVQLLNDSQIIYSNDLRTDRFLTFSVK